jgi:hypothetical protein
MYWWKLLLGVIVGEKFKSRRVAFVQTHGIFPKTAINVIRILFTYSPQEFFEETPNFHSTTLSTPMRQNFVRYASNLQGPKASVVRKNSLRKKGPTLGLDHFLQRSKTLGLWREIMRAVYHIPPSSTREEMRQFARSEFEQHRHVTDLQHIRYLVSSGKTQFDAMKRYVDEQARR